MRPCPWLHCRRDPKWRPGRSAWLGGVDLEVTFGRSDSWRNNWYWAAQTFFWEPLSSSSSEMDLSLTLSSESKPAKKLTGEASLGDDSNDDDLLMGERERVESLDSSITLARLTGVLDHLTGVLGRRSSVLAGVLDLLGGVSSSLGVGVVVCATGLAWAYGTAIFGAILRCMRVHIDMKSIKVVWLIALGSDGKSRLLTSDNMHESCPAAGVFPAGVPWATGSSILAGPSTVGSWWCAGPATPAGSSSSCAGPSPAGSWWCAGSATSAGSSTISGSSSVTMTCPLADPSPADPSPAGPFTASVWPVTVARSSTSAGPVTPADSSMPSGRVGDGITVMVLLSGDSDNAGDSCNSSLET